LFILMEVFRFLFRRGVYWLRKRGHLLSRAVVVGANPEGTALYDHLKNWHHSGLSIIGFVDDQTPIDEIVVDDRRVVGKIGDLERLVQEKNVTEVIVASGSLKRNQLLDIFRLVSWKPNVTLRLSSGLFEIISTGLHIKELASVPLIEVNKTRITGLDAIIKRITDLIIAALGFFILWPFFLLLAILIKLDSEGPVLYVHKVIGLNGTQFGAIKFRTMYHNSDHLIRSDENLAEQFHLNFKLKDDPRVTKLGRFLRQNSLDELPQLVNVLRGEMSIVGPRFICMDEVKKYGKWHMNLLTIKPGLTGLWQVSGRSDVSYEERIRLDMSYIRNWSIWQDLYVIIATIPAVLKRRGAY
jgi:exopolysaccharide biosynthesis polyprenyl glycosylphosphotransferase